MAPFSFFLQHFYRHNVYVTDKNKIDRGMFLTIYICLLQFLSLTYIKTFVIISWHGIILKCSIVTVTGQKKRPNLIRFQPLFIIIRNYYFTSMAFAACSTDSSPVFGISIDKIPFSILAEILSFSTLSGKRIACWNFE